MPDVREDDPAKLACRLALRSDEGEVLPDSPCRENREGVGCQSGAPSNSYRLRRRSCMAFMSCSNSKTEEVTSRCVGDVKKIWWCERGDSNPHGGGPPRDPKSRASTKFRHVRRVTSTGFETRQSNSGAPKRFRDPATAPTVGSDVLTHFVF